MPNISITQSIINSKGPFKDGLHKPCNTQVLTLKQYKQLKHRLKKAMSHCKDAVAVASNQVDININGEAPAAFLYNNMLYINPSYEPMVYAGTEDALEGCLSDPGSLYQVRRWNALVASYLAIKCNELTYCTELVTGFKARVFQHEIDHLNGRVIFNDQ